MILKWVGGKSKMTDRLISKIGFVAKDMDYLEPFCGGAALFWVLKKGKYCRSYHLNDSNSNLISFYLSLRDEPNALKENITKIAARFEKSKSKTDFYSELRTSYNENIRDTGSEQSARFYALNKLSFNGIYRVNRAGAFNVPFNKATTLSFNEERFEQSTKLIQNTVLTSKDFETINFDNKLLYLDPPYLPVTKTSSFTSYTKECFTEARQIELANKLKHSKNTKWVLSNSKPQTTYFEDLYAGFEVEYPEMRRAINSKGNERGKIREILISNF